MKNPPQALANGGIPSPVVPVSPIPYSPVPSPQSLFPTTYCSGVTRFDTETVTDSVK